MGNIRKGNFYDELLLSLIPNLRDYKHSSGAEGVAYFIGDEYVVKEYTKKDNWDYFDEIFDVYCKEMQHFADIGYSVPKIYSWIKVPNAFYFLNNSRQKNKYYILEEKIKGRYLFFGSFEEFYPMLRDKFSRSDYKYIIDNCKHHVEEFREILKSFINSFIETNEILLSMSEDKLAKFLTSAYQMHMTSSCSEPDLFPANVLVHGDNLNMIDNYVSSSTRSNLDPRNKADAFINNLIGLFLYNENLLYLTKPSLESYGIKESDFKMFLDAKEKDRLLLKEVLFRFIKILKKYCDFNKIESTDGLIMASSELHSFFDNSEDVYEIIETLQK